MRYLTTFSFLLSALFASAQIGRQELHTDSGSVVLHFFENGNVSTKEWWDPDGRWGRSSAYDRDGIEIFGYGTRRIGGHASVSFRYHDTGGISRADVSDAPDAGIQWYKSTTTFDELGVNTGFSEQGHDNDGPIPGLVTIKPAEGQRMFVNEVFLVNRTRHAGRAKVTAKHPSPALKDALHTIAPGDTIRLGAYSMGAQFPSPGDHVEVEVMQALLKPKKRIPMATFAIEAFQVSPEHRRHYLVITGYKKQK